MPGRGDGQAGVVVVLVVAATALVLGGYLLLSAIWDEVRLARHAAHTTGVVSLVHTSARGGRDATVDFTANGQQVRVVVPGPYAPAPAPTLDARVTVEYDPSHPQRARLAGTHRSLVSCAFLAVLCLLTVVPAAAGASRAARRALASARRQWYRSSGTKQHTPLS